MKHPIFLILLLGFSVRPKAQSVDSPAVRPTDSSFLEKKTRVILADDPSDPPDDLTSDPEAPRSSNFGSLFHLKSATIQLDFPKEPSASRVASLFHHFEVLDERPDTARIGVHVDRHNLGGARTRQLIFEHPASGEIAAYLDARFAHPGEAYAALVVIRTLWLSDANNMSEDMVQDPDKYHERRKIRLKAEVYAEKDGQYIPIFRFDSVQVALKGSYTRFGGDLSDLLEELADSASRLLAQKGGGGRKISRTDIIQFNQSRFDAPVCRDSTLVKGVYTSFKEFKDNVPSIKEYELKKEKDNLILYVKEAGGHSYYSHNAWGYCDGKFVYIMKDGVLVPAWKEGKAWYLYGRVHIINPKKEGGAYTPIGPSASSSITPGVSVSTTMAVRTNGSGSTQRHIFTVDMDSGNLY